MFYRIILRYIWEQITYSSQKNAYLPSYSWIKPAASTRKAEVILGRTLFLSDVPALTMIFHIEKKKSWSLCHISFTLGSTHTRDISIKILFVIISFVDALWITFVRLTPNTFGIAVNFTLFREVTLSQIHDLSEIQRLSS